MFGLLWEWNGESESLYVILHHFRAVSRWRLFFQAGVGRKGEIKRLLGYRHRCTHVGPRMFRSKHSELIHTTVDSAHG